MKMQKQMSSVTKAVIILMTIHVSACGITFKDKNDKPAAIQELVVGREYTVPIPEDPLKQIVLHFDRLVLRKDAAFITNGLNIRLEISELVSEGGIITTFAERKLAGPLTNGRDGGTLELFLGHATGKLLLRMQGEDGGTGAEGPAPDASLTGPKGPPGQNCLLSHGSVGCPRLPGLLATNGGQGGQGLPGFMGRAGYKGGDSGLASVYINASEQFNLVVFKIPGKGGAGGLGGAGGPGGAGGDPGFEDFPHDPNRPRTYTTVGPQGPQGPRGPQGPAGAPGLVQKVCVEKSGEPVDCESY